MPEWIHEREKHLKEKNPSMPEHMAWAIATQQSHATGHTPKGYGTAEGKHEAKAKYDEPKKEYEQTANPKTAGIIGHAAGAARSIGRKLTNAEAVENLAQQAAEHQAHIQHLQGQVRNAKILAGGAGIGAVGMHEMSKDKTKAASVVDGYSLAMFAGFSDEMQKIAGRLGEAAKTFGHYLAGGPRHVPENMQDMLPRVGNRLAAFKNPETRPDALKSLAARGAVGAAGVGLAGGVSAHNKNKHQAALQHAYTQGAQDALLQYAPGQ